MPGERRLQVSSITINRSCRPPERDTATPVAQIAIGFLNRREGLHHFRKANHKEGGTLPEQNSYKSGGVLVQLTSAKLPIYMG